MVIEGEFGEHYDRVLVDGEPLDPGPSQAVWNHSPDGFSWGYGGSGPAQLALAILLHECGDGEVATRYHQRFKADHVAKWPQASFRAVLDVRGWLEEEMSSDGVGV